MNFLLQIWLRHSKRQCSLSDRKLIQFIFVRTHALAVAYQPKEVESNKKNDYQAKKEWGRKTFRMILPPPNITGQLHLGHALMATIQDVIARRYRQNGIYVEWIPGVDHAGIATQAVVEKKILKEFGLTRQQMGREAFLREVWKWKAEKGKAIIDDLKDLGCTLSWEEEYFTMDSVQACTVNIAFVKLFEEGLIKRKKSLVNWSFALQSAVSDIEVDTLELKGPTEITVPGYTKNILFGKRYDFAYKILGGDDANDEIIVSTTRPETMLGDIAVAVHPEDIRYIKFRHISDVKLWHPFREEPIPLIFDGKVEKNFGTGAVKVTPAHDKVDFEIASRHLLDGKEVFDEQGAIMPQFGSFSGLPRFEARTRVLQKLAELHLLRATHDHAMNLPICSRSKDVIEYMLREQWFVHCQPMAMAAMEQVRIGHLQILPKSFETEWHRWLENCHDWCISRQLWWGHQIPAYYAENEEGKACWVAALSVKEAYNKAKNKLNAERLILKRDTDVLDTWFSSGLLPLSVNNWPSSEYKQKYPLDLMETGHDILFFWVARMVMLGLQLTGETPFKKVLLNGILRDAQGRKMSKSLGNIVTPKQVIQGASLGSLRQELQKSHDSGVLSDIELKRSLHGLNKMFPKGIPECGTDALRLTLCSHNIKSHFVNFDVSECYTNKLFFNKIWQATRFLLISAENLSMSLNEIESISNVKLGNWDYWILSRLAQTVSASTRNFDEYNLHTEAAALKKFLYTNLCDVYLETTKPMIIARAESGYLHCTTLATCLSWGLKALSPFAPFISSTLLSYLPRNIQISNLSDYVNPSLEEEVNDVLNVCQAIRQLKSRNKISKIHEPCLRIFAQTPQAYEKLRKHALQIQSLTLVKDIELHKSLPIGVEKTFAFYSTASHLCSFGITTNCKYEVPKDTHSKVNKELSVKLERLQEELKRYRLQVENEGFKQYASQEVQQKHREKIKQLEMEIRNVSILIC